MIQDRVTSGRSGYVPLLVGLILLLAGPLSLTITGPYFKNWPALLIVASLGLALFLIFAGILTLCGLAVVYPNQSRVLTLFGKYVGTLKEAGFYWVNPFYLKRLVSLRIRTFETGSQAESSTTKDAAGTVTTASGPKRRHPAKVNDLDGNPIEIAAVVVWRVIDSARVLFDVDNYEEYVHIQSESALRNLASKHPYDSHDDARISLRGNPEKVGIELQTELRERLVAAGVEVIEARISILAYASEIAAVMLRRQQASAILAARRIIVDGAVSMVELALDRLDAEGKVKLDDERRAAMVCNLLVVLCGDKDPQPVLNTGSLYTG